MQKAEIIFDADTEVKVKWGKNAHSFTKITKALIIIFAFNYASEIKKIKYAEISSNNTQYAKRLDFDQNSNIVRTINNYIRCYFVCLIFVLLSIQVEEDTDANGNLNILKPQQTKLEICRICFVDDFLALMSRNVFVNFFCFVMNITVVVLFLF